MFGLLKLKKMGFKKKNRKYYNMLLLGFEF